MTKEAELVIFPPEAAIVGPWGAALSGAAERGREGRGVRGGGHRSSTKRKGQTAPPRLYSGE